MDIQQFLYLVDGHLCCFTSVATTNKTITNVNEQIFKWAYALISLGYTLRSGMAASYSICIFNFL